MAKILPSLDAIKPSAGEDEPKPTKSLPVILQDLLNASFMLYLKAHKYHWNVTGMNFQQLHELFGEIYEDVFGGIDPLAENIRKLGVMADVSPGAGVGAATSDTAMISDLVAANDSLIVMLKDAEEAACYYEEEAIANFLADRLGMQQKWAWQLKACLGR
jgi:starvation-inducible DNA-binding protein